ncbi:MAG TPA: hypothetical protein VF057_10295, partial [Thermoanaerobaculia bacterium]
MKRAAMLLALLLAASPLFSAAEMRECSLCVGAATNQLTQSATPVPQLIRTTDEGLSQLSFESLPPEQRAKLTVQVSFSLEGDEPLARAERRAQMIVDWARENGPFDTLVFDIEHDDPATIAFAIKRLAVVAQGLGVAKRFAVAPMPIEEMEKLFEHGAQAYFDAWLVPATEVKSAAAWLAEHDPAKKLLAAVTPSSPNPLYDTARALADGAVLAFIEGGDVAAIANVNRALGGDYAFDATAQTTILDTRGGSLDMPALSFVRGEDLRTIIIPFGTATPFIVSLPATQYAEPHRVDAAGEKAVTDSGLRGGRLLVGLQPSAQPYLLFVNRAEKVDTAITREAIDVATERGITVEEIIRNHQSYDAFQESIQPRYIARNTTKLRFAIAAGEAVEATIAGDYFSDPSGRADWVWQDFLINGVRWRYGRIPELPLIQPEKVTQLPLDIHLSNEYRYQLVRETDLAGYRVYEVRFEPPPNAPIELPLYRGTVWIEKRTWARVRIAMVQLNLTGEVLSNEERVDFQPFDRNSYAPLSATEAAARDPRSLIWLPIDVAAQQVIS